jgi:hypothetical protein
MNLGNPASWLPGFEGPVEMALLTFFVGRRATPKPVRDKNLSRLFTEPPLAEWQ